ncbi:MAG TPA: D-alanine--poly(phosphoribitol) ligase, partial [Erysipelotrichaceae bacterium]|nr:D-alanine--poly(phosphoribitol) ligase [Erysipelotrichaceae bacterium]
DIDKRSLKIALMDRLPRFMIPTKMIQVEDMPLNKNGKIDRKALMEVYKNANRRHR